MEYIRVSFYIKNDIYTLYDIFATLYIFSIALHADISYNLSFTVIYTFMDVRSMADETYSFK